MAEEPHADTIRNLEDRLRKVVATATRAYVAVLAMFAVISAFISLQVSIDVIVEFPPSSQFALLSVVVATVVGLLAMGRTVIDLDREGLYEDRGSALLAALLQIVGFGSCMVAAAVGWAAVLADIPHQVSMSGIVWFFVSFGVALIASAVIELVPARVARDLAAERRRRRGEWVERARAHWGRRRMTTSLLAMDIGLLAAWGVAVVGTIVVHGQMGGTKALPIASALGMWLASGAITVITYVLRRWEGCTLMLVGSILYFLLVLQAVLIGAWGAGSHIADMALWLLVAALGAVWVGHSFKRGCLRALMCLLLGRARRAIDRANNPECECGEVAQPRLAHLRQRHALVTGREWPPVVRCPAHPEGMSSRPRSPASDDLAA